MGNIIYVLTNPAMPGLVKIGWTDEDYAENRIEGLYTSGVPMPFCCITAREIEGRPAEEAEKALHDVLREYRPNPAREFFRLNPDDAKALVEKIPGTPVCPSARSDLPGLFPDVGYNPGDTPRLPPDVLVRLADWLNGALAALTASRKDRRPHTGVSRRPPAEAPTRAE